MRAGVDVPGVDVPGVEVTRWRGAERREPFEPSPSAPTPPAWTGNTRHAQRRLNVHMEEHMEEKQSRRPPANSILHRSPVPVSRETWKRFQQRNGSFPS